MELLISQMLNRSVMAVTADMLVVWPMFQLQIGTKRKSRVRNKDKKEGRQCPANNSINVS